MHNYTQIQSLLSAEPWGKANEIRRWIITTYWLIVMLPTKS
jgi:hypothetical protein